MKEVSREITEAFQSLYKGRNDVWGSVEGLCNKEAVTLEHYHKHLIGEKSLGIYPLLDDGTCHWAAIDIDVKDFKQAKQVRDTLFSGNIPAYIAASKSKGYHCYCFALERFKASEIRSVLNYVLKELGIKAEIFPKQDVISEVTPYGNYINLPVFGATRPFLTTDLKEVPLEIAINKIKYVPQEAIERILEGIPKEPPPKKKEKSREAPRRHPPCIEAILKGVTEPGRDEAAFALARYYIDELKYLPDDVPGILQEWDKRNKPPIGNERLLEIKVRSAEKGYKFGCKSIIDNVSLSKFCVGEEKCEWLQELVKKKESERYLIIERNAKGKITSVKVDKKVLIDDLKEEFIFKSVFGIVRDDILVYENGVYTHNGEKVIREECEMRVPLPYLTTNAVHEIRDRIAGTTFTNREMFNTEKYIINLENGLLNVNTKELIPHAPDFLSTMRIPITYDPQAKCPEIQGFLNSILREKDTKVILEFFGYSLIPDYSIPVVLILLGEGSNGKTQLLRLLSRFISKDNYTTVSLQDIEDNSFAVANLEGKLLNMQGDLSSKWLSGIGMLKQLSGQDPIYANRKHRDPIQFDNFARLVFASNKPPKIEEDTLAIWRRILPIDLPNKFEGEKDIKNIIETIVTPQELSGLLNLALERLQRLLNKGDFSYQGSYIDRSRHYTIASDPVRIFVEECCNVGSDFRILKDELYQEYIIFCKKNKIQVSGEAQFGKELRNAPGLSINDKQYQEEGVRVRWWLGITLKAPEPETEPEEPNMDV